MKWSDEYVKDLECVKDLEDRCDEVEAERDEASDQAAASHNALILAERDLDKERTLKLKERALKLEARRLAELYEKLLDEACSKLARLDPCGHIVQGLMEDAVPLSWKDSDE